MSVHTQLKKLKHSLKQWEIQFCETNKRKPTKDDIGNAPDNVKELYKSYWRLKSRESSERLTTANDGDQASKKSDQIAIPRPNGVWGTDLNKQSPAHIDSINLATNIYSTKLQAAVFNNKTLSPSSFPKKSAFLRQQRLQMSSTSTTDVTSDSSVIKSSNGESQAAVASCNGLNNNPEELDLARSSFHYQVKSINCHTKLYTEAIPSHSLTKPKLHIVDISWLERCEPSILQPIGATSVITCSNESPLECDVPSSSQHISKGFSAHVKGPSHEVSSQSHDNILHTKLNNVQPVKSKNSTFSNINGFPDVCTPGISKFESGDATDSNVCQISSAVSGNGSVRSIAADSSDGCGNAVENSRKRKHSVDVPNSRKRKKIDAGNFVRLNLKKKVYVRGKKKFNLRRYKWLKNKRAKEKQCLSDEDAELSKKDSNEELFEVVDSVHFESQQPDDKILEEESKLFTFVEPLFEVDGDEKLRVPKSVYAALKLFGHDGFRAGQDIAIMRILSGQSTLVVQPTGSGKSLCYQLPAYMYSKRSSCITLVISPLISLMEDQVAWMPSCLRAACIHNNMTPVQRQKIRDRLARCEVDILFVSPETIVGRMGTGYSCLPRKLPPVAFICVDEVHCVWEWSFNFRPSYLQLCKLLINDLGARCILGLTATATLTTMENIARHLNIPKHPESIIKELVLPPNLNFSASVCENREQAVIDLLSSKELSSCNSVIIYCIRREQTERLASLIRTRLQVFDNDGREWTAEAYHAGLSSATRRSVQKRFLSNKLRVVVATVAFGMGLNKSDIRAVLHFGLPKSFENYIQEVGRAGRDGKPAMCHAFLDTQGEDLRELQRHVHGNTCDRYTIRRLLQRVFRSCKCLKISQLNQEAQNNSNEITGAGNCEWTYDEIHKKRLCTGHQVAIPIKDTVQELDVKAEGIATLLCMLESHPNSWAQLLSPSYTTCQIFCYHGPQEMRGLQQKVPAIAVAFAKYKPKQSSNGARIQFPLVEVASLLGCDAVSLQDRLRALKWKTITVEGETRWQRTGVNVDFSDECLRVRSLGDLAEDERDHILAYLHDKVVAFEKQALTHLNMLYNTLRRIVIKGSPTLKMIDGNVENDFLRTALYHYFEHGIVNLDCNTPTTLLEVPEIILVGVRSDISSFLCIYQEYTFTGRAVARIFHGIGSPNYPAEMWGKVRRFWRRHLDVEFNLLCNMATAEILRLK